MTKGVSHNPKVYKIEKELRVGFWHSEINVNPIKWWIVRLFYKGRVLKGTRVFQISR